MKFKSYLLLSSALIGLINVSCHDKDEDNDNSVTDPRIRSVHVHGLNVPFVVNDYEKVIYNYDSLTYGTDLSHRMIYFSDYDVKYPGLRYFVNQGKGWEPFTNRTLDSVFLDLSDLKVLTVSYDNSHSIEYKVDIRVHKYDINSFNWEKLADLKFNGEVESFKSAEINGKYYYFYTNKAGDSYVLSSTTGKKWTSKALKKQNYDWSSLTVMADKAVAFVDGKIAVIDVDNAYAVSLKKNSAGVKALLFTLGDNHWAIGDDGFYTCSDGDFAFKKLANSPAGVPTENITSLVTMSGARTRIGYVYGVKDGVASMWAVDKGGNIVKTSTSSTSNLPVYSKMALLSVDNELCLLGGINSDDQYQNTCFSSSDAGINWVENWHKELPSEIGRTANLGAFLAESGKVVYVSGETANGVATAVWTGSLKGSDAK